MTRIAILSDSASNVRENREVGIFIVPLYVNFQDGSKKNLEEISPQELYDRIETEEPKTSAPGVEDFLTKIQQIQEAGYGKILAIAVSQSLSGTYNSMRLALDSQDMDYRLIDSKTITMGQGLLLTYGHQLIQEGLILDEIAEKLEEKKRNVKIFAGVGDLKYLVRGGRLSRVKGLIGGSLRLNPILTLAEDGSIENYKSVMGKKRTLNFIVDKVRMDLAGGEPYYLALAYAGDRDKLGEVKDKLGDLVDGADQYLEGPVTAVLGTHSGPDAYVVAYLRL